MHWLASSPATIGEDAWILTFWLFVASACKIVSAISSLSLSPPFGCALYGVQCAPSVLTYVMIYQQFKIAVVLLILILLFGPVIAFINFNCFSFLLSFLFSFEIFFFLCFFRFSFDFDFFFCILQVWYQQINQRCVKTSTGSN